MTHATPVRHVTKADGARMDRQPEHNTKELRFQFTQYTTTDGVTHYYTEREEKEIGPTGRYLSHTRYWYLNTDPERHFDHWLDLWDYLDYLDAQVEVTPNSN